MARTPLSGPVGEGQAADVLEQVEAQRGQDLLGLLALQGGLDLRQGVLLDQLRAEQLLDVDVDHPDGVGGHVLAQFGGALRMQSIRSILSV